ncbi:TPA: ATP-dependent helicase [Vibrio parahaemolyticus]|uniref:DEAD/DEAH box helicase n=1 Tax=Vibrio parahaemolyticus TaxID=670 RepID=UPI001121E878|nr:DEAD/DEAH box helicase family protein [Vibrio parahaemolyticus]EJA7342139.1 ATP-dependent helicase [Vibrio parahaemolyticus]MBY3749284.1 ATP-dependent helicase [Vibrio parahaemolyticus]MBY3761898.1 ATP-dependent helicase [Vibrio parahaemolyticus]MBY3763370.1 ATP-dependent helicase [Vibrio parahaemolyticus]MBY3775842.1 ATP-dependent helicase [Vibrio parahaemolyticus]
MQNNILQVSYNQTGQSASHNDMGMREMQARAFAERASQYLLIKAPPASGKSRALMFLGLDKLIHQSVRKLIVAVPEMSIGGSFKDTDLMKFGFFANWTVKPENNLCISGSESGKTNAFKRFMESDDQILVCTHSTLRSVFDKLLPTDFDNCLVAIDEFHHVSADENSRLGSLIDVLMNQSSAHIIAMTGSYFRGDTVPILLPEDEAKFTKVTYTYYEQLNGYKYLKTLGIGYHFYQGLYVNALPSVLDPARKTIIHIPNVNSVESTKDKYTEVDSILEVLGDVMMQDPETGIYQVKCAKTGKTLLVANLVDDSDMRPKVQAYLRDIESAEQMDIIIALGMAKEGFDWPYCEHVLTIGYRSSMTEIVQIIGRATRDSEGKSHAQFTNLIAQPDAQDDDVKISVNNMLKAITTSLLMEQILAPSIQFKPRSQWNGEDLPANTLIVDDTTTSVSQKVLDILNGGKDEILSALLSKESVVKGAIADTMPAEVINEIELPSVIQTLYPDLEEHEIEQIRTGVLHSLYIGQKGGLIDGKDLPKDAVIEDGGASYGKGNNSKEHGESGTSNQFIKMGDKFINIESLDIDLIDSVNPFHGAYEILSKSVDAAVLKTIQQTVRASQANVSEEEAVMLWPRIKAFRVEHQREPSLNSSDPIEQRYADVLAYIRRMKQQRMAQQ